MKKVKIALTFFAHPDDEVLGAGGTLAKLAGMSCDIHIVIPATGIHSRRNKIGQKQRDKDLVELQENCQQALGILGVKPDNIYFGEFPDNEMDSETLLSAVQFLEKYISKLNPDLIITHHWRCTNIDHQYCHEAVVVASRPSVDKHIDVICAEIPSSTGYLKPTMFEPNLYVELTKEQVEKKVLAMQTYKGESRPYPHPRSSEVLTALAQVRGSEAGYCYAEAFMIQKGFG